MNLSKLYAFSISLILIFPSGVRAQTIGTICDGLIVMADAVESINGPNGDRSLRRVVQHKDRRIDTNDFFIFESIYRPNLGRYPYALTATTEWRHRNPAEARLARNDFIITVVGVNHTIASECTQVIEDSITGAPSTGRYATGRYRFYHNGNTYGGLLLFDQNPESSSTVNKVDLIVFRE